VGRIGKQSLYLERLFHSFNELEKGEKEKKTWRPREPGKRNWGKRRRRSKLSRTLKVSNKHRATQYKKKTKQGVKLFNSLERKEKAASKSHAYEEDM